ncbi:MAG: hypothetical protein J6Q17_00960 [Clostridia bacterium]|nr:hypothetical protein [Clostridia bacterium]
MIRKNILFWLSVCFAAFFIAGIITVLFTDANVVRCVIPPYLGFCFTYPLWRRNRKMTPDDREK